MIFPFAISCFVNDPSPFLSYYSQLNLASLLSVHMLTGATQGKGNPAIFTDF